MSNYALDLDQEVVNHLGDQESVRYFRTENIQPDLVLDEKLRKVFAWQMNYVREFQKPASASVLENEFESLQIQNPETDAKDLITRLRERYGRTHGEEVVRNLARVVHTDPGDLAKELYANARQISERLTPKGESFGEDDFQRSMYAYDQLVVKGRGPSLGFSELDDYFHGQLGLTVLVGSPKSMKSWVTIKAVYENILAGKKVYLASLELPAFETDMRLRCLAAKIPYWKFTKRALSNQDKTDLEEASEILAQWGTYRIDKPPRGERSVDILIDKAEDFDVIFIDQLQYVENDRKRTLGELNETGEYWEALNRFRDYSDDQPVYVVHQFNRNATLNCDSMPEIHHAKGSSGIEECATLALGLWASKEMKKSSLLHLGALVSRNYELLTWELELNFRNSCWLNVIDEVNDDET